jgi:multimeric flavodoxin WrbA
MKAILVNGSPNAEGCTYTALLEIQKTLADEGVESEIFQLGKKPLAGCIDCGVCSEAGRCVFDDKVNDFLVLAENADGFVFGSPVHYAAATGALTSFLDRVFRADSSGGRNAFHLKPGAAILSARRAGTVSALDQLNKYFLISQMPIVSSRYWNMVHGNTPDEVLQDLEGLQIMRVLARNMAWFLKCKAAGEAAGVEMPETEARQRTNFIR